MCDEHRGALDRVYDVCWCHLELNTYICLYLYRYIDIYFFFWEGDNF